MNEEVLRKVQENSEKLDAVYRSVEKTRKYFLWTLIITTVMFVLPLIGLAFVIPYFLRTLGSIYSF